jgi:hypothetical protein
MPNQTELLLPGESLNINPFDYLVSSDKRFRLYVEDDGSLALYAYRSDSGRTLLKSWPCVNPFSTPGGAPHGQLIFAHDAGAGWVMLYLVNPDVPASWPPTPSPDDEVDNNFNKRIIFQAGPGDFGVYSLGLQSDGNLVMNRQLPSGAFANPPPFASGTKVTEPTVASPYIIPNRPVVQWADVGVLGVETDGSGVLQSDVYDVIGARDGSKYMTIPKGGSVPIAAAGLVSVNVTTYYLAERGLNTDPTPHETPQSGDSLPSTPPAEVDRQGNLLSVRQKHHHGTTEPARPRRE